MKIINVKEFRDHLYDYIDQAMDGETIIIAKFRSKRLMAKLVKITEEDIKVLKELKIL